MARKGVNVNRLHIGLAVVASITSLAIVVYSSSINLSKIDPLEPAQILGKSDTSSSNSGSGSSSSGSNSGSSSDDSDEKEETRSDTTTSNTEAKTVTLTPTPTSKQESTRTEVRLGEDEKIRVRTDKDGRTRTDIYSGGTKVRLERRDDRVVLKVEDESGVESELTENELFSIKERLGDSQIRVATASGDRLVVAAGAVGAATRFPVSVDLNTNALIITTPSGIKTVSVLPDLAVKNIIAANIIDRIGTLSSTETLDLANLENLDGVIELAEQNGLPIYEIRGISQKRFLGLIPIEVQKTITVSADTGDAIGVTRTPINVILDLLSF